VGFLVLQRVRSAKAEQALPNYRITSMEKLSAEDFKKMMAKKHKRKNPKANELTKEIIRFLSLNGYVVWRNNTVGIFDIKQAAQKLFASKQIASVKHGMSILKTCYRKSHDRKGAPDIIGYQKKTGKFIGVEVKAGKDQESVHQKQFRMQAVHAGAIHIVARSLDDVIDNI